MRPRKFVPTVIAVSVFGLGMVGCATTGGGVPRSSETASSASDSAPGTIEMRIAEDPTVSMAIWFDVGSSDDPPGKEGLAYVTGQLLSEGGTKQNSYREILDALFPLAAGYSVRVDKEMTTLTGRVHSDNLGEYLELFKAAFLEPAFDEADFERIRTNAVNAIEKSLRYASDEELGKAALELLVHGEDSYAHPVVGTVSGLRSLTIDDVKQFYAGAYTGSNAILALGGGYTDEVRRDLLDAIDSLPDGSDRGTDESSPADRLPDSRSVLLVDKPGADASISFGHPIDVKRGDREYYALFIANSWLGEHRNQSSHLFQVIREKRGMNYGDYAYIEAFPEGGSRQFPPPNVARNRQLFQVWIRTLPNEWAHFAIRAAVREVEALVENGMTEEDFELTRSFLKKYVLHFADTSSARLGYAIDDRFYGIEGHLDTFRRMMDEITLEDVNAALEKHIHPESFQFAIVTGEAAMLAEALTADSPSPITYPTPKSAEILEEDVAIASHSLGIAAENVSVVPVDSIFEE